MNLKHHTDVAKADVSSRPVHDPGTDHSTATDSLVDDTARKQLEIANELKELERQVERANIFGCSTLGEGFLRLGEIEMLLHGLTDALLAKGLITEGEIAVKAANVRRQLIERGELSGPGTLVRVEKPVADPPTKVDCGARLHICHAVCCKLDFALSVSELESGKIKWDLGRPYFIRHNNHGSCVHLDPVSQECRVYADRPRVCQQYSCANDPRIWKDFENMELNHEWIEANLSTAKEPRVVRALMHESERLAATAELEQPTPREEEEQ